MKMNMKQWVEDYRKAKVKKAMPILSFPGAQLIGKTVEELVRDGHLQALCMEAMAKRYEMGVAVSLMDLSVEAEAFGGKVLFSKDDVPTMHGALIEDEAAAEALEIPKVGAGRTGECIKGIKEATELIKDRPVFAGIIGPYSLAGRLLDMTEIMVLCYEEPEMVETVLEKVTVFLVEYAKAFKEAGANGIIMAEPAAGLLSPNLIKEFSNPYVQRIKNAVEDDNFLFIYHNCGNITPLLSSVKEIDACVYSVGNAIDMEDAFSGLGDDSIIIGNLDPAGVIRNATPNEVKAETLKLLSKHRHRKNFVLSSGCDIPPATPLENLDAFFEAWKEFYKL